MSSRRSAKDIKQQYELQAKVTGTEQAAQDLSDLAQSTNKLSKSSDILNLSFGEVEQALYATRSAIGSLQNLETRTIEQQEQLNQLYRDRISLQERRRTLSKQVVAEELAGSEEAARAVARESQAQRRLLENLGSRARLYGDVESRSRAIIDAGTSVAGGAGGQIGQAAFVGTDILGAVEGFKLLKLELPQLIKNMELTRGKMITLAGGIGAVSLAAAALYLAYKDLNASMSEQRDIAARLVSRTRSMLDVMVDVQDKSSEQVIEIIRGLETEIELRQRAINVNRQNLQAAESTQSTMDKIFDKFGDSNADQFRSELEELEGKQREAISTLQSYQASLGTGTVAANDAAEAEKELADAREEAARKQEGIILAWISTQAQFEADLRKAQDANTMSLDEYFGKMREFGETQQLLEHQIALLTSAYEQGLVSEEAYYDRLAELNEELWRSQDLMEAYRDNFNVFSKMLQAGIDKLGEFKGVDIVKGGIAGMLQAGSEAVQASRDAFDEFLDNWEEFQIDWLRAEEDFQIARARDLEDHYIKLAQIDAKFAEQLAKIEQDKNDFESKDRKESRDELREFLKKERRAFEDHRDRLLDIRDRMNASIRDASAKLDAYAIWQAKQRAAEEERDEKREYAKAKRRRLEDFLDRQRERQAERRERLNDFNQKIQDLKDQHMRERAEAIRQFNRQQQIELENFNLRMQRFQADFIRQQEMLNQEFQARYGIELYWWDQLQLLTNSSMGAFVQTVNNNLNKIAPTIGGDTPVGVGALPAFARGGVLRRGYGVVGEQSPELIRSLSPVSVTPLNRAPANIRGGNVTNNFNNTGNFTHKYLEMVATKAAKTVVDSMLGKR